MWVEKTAVPAPASGAAGLQREDWMRGDALDALLLGGEEAKRGRRREQQKVAAEEEEETVSARELNPYLRGEADESYHPPPLKTVGDGGISWRQRAIALARQNVHPSLPVHLTPHPTPARATSHAPPHSTPLRVSCTRALLCSCAAFDRADEAVQAIAAGEDPEKAVAARFGSTELPPPDTTTTTGSGSDTAASRDPYVPCHPSLLA
jgi:hypothetical protein